MKATSKFDFAAPVRLHFGNGLLDRLGEFCGDAERILLVTGRSSAKKTGLLDRAQRALRGKQVTLFDRIEPNPSIQAVESGAAAARKAKADLVVGLGGGSPMDAAKAIAALATNKGGFYSLYGKAVFPHAPLPMIAIPTTCGTGSEANKYAIITDNGKSDKLNFFNSQTYPVAGLLDPSVLAGIPRHVLVGTALDAFCHAFEGFMCTLARPFTDTLALDAMVYVLASLPAAREGDKDSLARLLYASSIAGIVIDHTGTTILHAIGYRLTLDHGIPHGNANALLLPLMFEYCEEVAPERMKDVYSAFPPKLRRRRGFVRYLEDIGLVLPVLGNCFRPETLGPVVDYVLARKSAMDRTPGHPDKATLMRLLKKHVKRH